MNIQDDPKTLPCPTCHGEGRVWHEGLELGAQYLYRKTDTDFYRENTDECAVCHGLGTIPFPEIKR